MAIVVVMANVNSVDSNSTSYHGTMEKVFSHVVEDTHDYYEITSKLEYETFVVGKDRMAPSVTGHFNYPGKISWLIGIMPAGVSLNAIRYCLDYISEFGHNFSLGTEHHRELVRRLSDTEIEYSDRTVALATRAFEMVRSYVEKSYERNDLLNFHVREIGKPGQFVFGLFSSYPSE